MVHQHPVFMHVQPPPFLDQRCFNLVKAKKGVRRWGLCQIISGYILIALNAIALLQNFFFLFTVGSWTNLPVEDEKGRIFKVNLPEGGLIFLTVLKSLISILMIRWGLMAVRTFKPLIKDLHRQEMAGMFGNQNSEQVGGVKRSKDIKAYKKKVIKLIIATVVLVFISCLYARCYFNRVADKMLDDYYKTHNQTQNNHHDKVHSFP